MMEKVRNHIVEALTVKIETIEQMKKEIYGVIADCDKFISEVQDKFEKGYPVDMLCDKIESANKTKSEAQKTLGKCDDLITEMKEKIKKYSE